MAMDRKRSGKGVPYSHIGGPMQRSASDIDNDTDVLPSTVSNGRRRHRLWIVAAFCTIACFDSAISGIMLSFSSGTLLELDKVYRDGDHVRGVQEGSMFASLIGSFIALGGLFGGPLAWLVLDRLGRKPALMFGGIFTFVGWLLIALTQFVSGSRTGFLAMFLVGRLLTGFGAGWASLSVSVYIAEVASAKLKGLFGACNWLFFTIGSLVGYGLGAIAVIFDNFTYYHVAIIAVGLVFIFEFLMLFTRETPRWLYVHGKDVAGMKVLRILRGPQVDIQEEMEGIRKAIKNSAGLPLAAVIRAIKYRTVFIPFILSLLLKFFQVFGGMSVVIFYAGSVLKLAGVGGTGSDADEKATIFATISVGVVQVVMTFVGVLLVDCLGRRVLLIVSGIGLLASSGILGAHFLIIEDKCHGCLGINCTSDNVTHLNDFFPCDNTNFGLLAILSLALFVAAFSIGWGPIPWLAMSELLPLPVRGLLGGVIIMMDCLFGFILTVSFVSYADAVTTKFAWWSFSAVMCVGVSFVFLFLPETKGHTLEEIEANFEQGHIFAVSCRGRRQGVNVST